MKKSYFTIFWIVLIAGFVSAGVWFTMSVTYSNKQIEIFNVIESQHDVCKMTYESMIKIIKSKAKVTDKGYGDFKEIMGYVFEQRYQNDNGGQLMRFITESNPNFDMSLYKDLMTTIEHKRSVFLDEQKVLIDMNNTYKNLLQKIPSKWFVDQSKTVDITLVSSIKTEAVYETGMENDIDIF